MFKLIFGLIFKIRDFLQKKFGDLFEKFRDPDTGKVTFARPGTLKFIVGVSSLIVFFLILLSRVFNNSDMVSGGMEAYEKENRPVTGIGSRDLRQGSLEDDPFKGLNSLTRDEFDNVQKIGGSGVSGIIGSDGATPLSAAECVEVFDKMKSNQKLSTEDEILAEQCLKENPMGLTAEELKFAEMMLDPNLSDTEKALLAKALSGNATEEELAVARALTSGDSDKVAQAKSAIQMGDAAIAALGKSLQGKPLDDTEKALLAKINEASKGTGQKITDIIQKEILNGFSETELPKEIADSAKQIELPSAQDEAIKILAQDVASREELIKQLEDQLSKEQIQISPIADKLGSGKQLTPQETKRLQDFTKSKQQLESLKKLQEERKTEFAKRATKFQQSLAQAVTTVQSTLPSGTFIEYEGEAVDCNKIKPLAVKRKKKIVVSHSKTVLDIDGRPLKPEEIEFIKLYRKNQYEVARLSKDTMKGPVGLDGLGQSVNVATLAGEGGQVGIQDLQSLFVFKDASLKNFELTPDMKIPAVLDSELLVSDKGKGQVMRFRILADVHNPQTNQIVIPKGAVAIAQSGSFDTDTGMMDISIEKAVVGSGKSVTVKLMVGSADGSMGLRGRVYDTTGKYLAGAFITAFSAGALSWFSQQVIAPFQTSKGAGQALSGAGLAGGAEVMTKIAELYSSKLQNSAIVFWVPKGIPVVLFPQ